MIFLSTWPGQSASEQGSASMFTRLPFRGGLVVGSCCSPYLFGQVLYLVCWQIDHRVRQRISCSRARPSLILLMAPLNTDSVRAPLILVTVCSPFTLEWLQGRAPINTNRYTLGATPTDRPLKKMQSNHSPTFSTVSMVPQRAALSMRQLPAAQARPAVVPAHQVPNKGHSTAQQVLINSA